MRTRGVLAALTSLLITCVDAATARDATTSCPATRPEVGFWAPRVPPRTHYKVECSIDPDKGQLRGSGRIRFKNTSRGPISRLPLHWPLRAHGKLELSLNGQPASRPAGIVLGTEGAQFLVDLPIPVSPGRDVVLDCRFRASQREHDEQDRLLLRQWLPRLWWGFPTSDDFDVKIDLPSGYALATSGRLDEGTGYYHVDGARSFGLFVGKGMQRSEAMAGDVLVQCIHTSRGQPCARLMVATAVDAINFYRERFGFYPYKSLSIIPGGDRPIGGYPAATAIIGIHGPEQMAERSKLHWRWITVHEIGHQYWGEYVLEKDSPGWLWIGLGIFSDREYARSRGLGTDKHRMMMGRYIDGVRQHRDTTVARTPEQMAGVTFDFNNVVIHGKGFSIVSALACVLGQEIFDRIIQRCLEEFAGRRLGAAEFQAVCESETGQDLAWFFDQWVRSDRELSYRVTPEQSVKQGRRYVTRVRVECLGTLQMPVPVSAEFEDGTSQLRFADRLPVTQVLTFESSTPLKRVQLDPKGELPLVAPSLEGPEQSAAKAIKKLPLTGAGERALAVFREAKQAGLCDADLWGKLGLMLYDGEYYAKALEALRRTKTLAGPGSSWRFASLVWQGHVLDLQGRREDALACYRAALKLDAASMMQHDQYNMKIDQAWVQQRIKTPFRRRR